MNLVKIQAKNSEISKDTKHGTNFPQIFEDGIVLTRLKFQSCRRYAARKFARILKRYFEISVGQSRIFKEQFNFSIAVFNF